MLASSLALMLIVYGTGVARVWRTAGYGRGVRPREAAAFRAGRLAIAIALSPAVDELSDTWLVAHMIQHELLMVIAAPLIAVSGPLIALLWAVPAGLRRPALEALRHRPVPAVWAFLTAPA